MMSNLSPNSEIDNNERHNIRNYVILKTLGRGAFGTVYLTYSKGENENERYALKQTFQDTKYKNREGDVLKMLSHPGIVEIFDIFYTKQRNSKYLNIVMEYFPETLHDLIERLQDHYLSLTYSDINWYSFQLMRACGYLETLNICHRDIKPQNILVNHKKKLIKLCDFGSAKILKEDSENKHYICSRFYRAPELLFKSMNYSCSVDLWSVGCCIAEMYIAEPLFAAHNTKHQIILIKNVLGPTPPKYPIISFNDREAKNIGIASISKWIKTLKIEKNHKKLKYPLDQLNDHQTCYDLLFLRQILQYNPNQRLNLKQTFEHPYFKKFTFPENNIDSTYPEIKWTSYELDIRRNIRDSNIVNK